MVGWGVKEKRNQQKWNQSEWDGEVGEGSAAKE